jgi:signal peptidase II
MAPWAWAIALSGIVVALDQATKQIVVDAVEPGDPVEVGLGVEIVNVRNDGVAFGLLTGGDAVVLLLTLGSLALLTAYFALHSTRPGLWVAVGLLAGGALGNLADRLRIGSVVDFLDPPVWPAFNVADVGIVAGVVLLLMVLAAPSEAR